LNNWHGHGGFIIKQRQNLKSKTLKTEWVWCYVNLCSVRFASLLKTDYNIEISLNFKFRDLNLKDKEEWNNLSQALCPNSSSYQYKST
jgi:hypothetical protein